ncbi:glycine betaine ABC transporter substrate-binding protein [Desulfovermiculus halophilus]|uniref:glycine betaine ABC transporter substrate-binding protein n=1 Tax=Desulfovermiculus halophilus TaxID=339722 RepID=UPI00048404DA|nr:glycine betaine ABC transporter substrate-binding protein [Desulfovermiculus halophilus]
MRKIISTAILVLVCSLLFGTTMAGAAEYNKPIRIGWTAWSSTEANTKLVKAILEDVMGYDVELVMADVGIQYQGVANGDIDFMLMCWLPVTHKAYWEKVGDKVVNLGPVFTRAKLGWVVPEYIPEDKISSITDLTDPEVKEKLGGKIMGIDPGAGLMQASEKAMTTYGLKDAGYELISSSGAGMTAALSRAVKNKDWIVVTGWSPHWKFAKWDLRYIEDPEGVLGGRESASCIARQGFYQDVPYEVFEFLTRYFIPAEDLQAIMYQARQTSYEDAAQKYIEENPQRIKYWVTGDF